MVLLERVISERLILLRDPLVSEKFALKVAEIVDSFLASVGHNEWVQVRVVRDEGCLEELRSLDEEHANRLGYALSSLTPVSAAWHEAWAGLPTITVVEAKARSRPWKVFEAELLKASCHAVLHGSPEYYVLQPPSFWLKLRAPATIALEAFNLVASGARSYEAAKLLAEKRGVEVLAVLLEYHLPVKEWEKTIWKNNPKGPLAFLAALATYRALAEALPALCVETVERLVEENLAQLPEKAAEAVREMLLETAKKHETTHSRIERVARVCIEKLAPVLLV